MNVSQGGAGFAATGSGWGQCCRAGKGHRCGGGGENLFSTDLYHQLYLGLDITNVVDNKPVAN